MIFGDATGLVYFLGFLALAFFYVESTRKPDATKDATKDAPKDVPKDAPKS